MNDPIFISPVVPEEIISIISSLNTKKSIGPHSISVKLLKMLKAHIAPQLAMIIIESFSTRLFPDKLKLAKVIPIHKKGSIENCNNYRPISLLPVFSKIFEKLFLDEKISYIQTSLASEKTTLLNLQLSLLQRKLKDQLMMVTLSVVYF